MTPTNRLRFVEREEKIYYYTIEDGGTSRVEFVRVLQQWWNDTGPNGGPDVGMWRDVPLEQE